MCSIPRTRITDSYHIIFGASPALDNIWENHEPGQIHDQQKATFIGVLLEGQ
jgi:hypothetical protein